MMEERALHFSMVHTAKDSFFLFLSQPFLWHPDDFLILCEEVLAVLQIFFLKRV